MSLADFSPDDAYILYSSQARHAKLNQWSRRSDHSIILCKGELLKRTVSWKGHAGARMIFRTSSASFRLKSQLQISNISMRNSLHLLISSSILLTNSQISMLLQSLGLGLVLAATLCTLGFGVSIVKKLKILVKPIQIGENTYMFRNSVIEIWRLRSLAGTRSRLALLLAFDRVNINTNTREYKYRG